MELFYYNNLTKKIITCVSAEDLEIIINTENVDTDCEFLKFLSNIIFRTENPEKAITDKKLRNLWNKNTREFLKKINEVITVLYGDLIDVEPFDF